MKLLISRMMRIFLIQKSIYYIFNEQLHYGDFFICAAERQRDFWLGMLAALNRVNPYSYNEDPTLKKMIDVVPFGLPTNKPIHTREVLKGQIDGIGKDDFVIIWGGGIYNWFDPLTLIKSMARIAEIRDDIKLFFMGVKHPNPQVRELRLVNDTIDLAKKLNIFGKNVFFNYGWVEYNERQNYLLESDVGIITHPAHIETRFSFRTRILDYIWAGLPIISTRGDCLSELVEKKVLGITARDGNVEDIVNAIIKLADDKKFYDECLNNLRNISKEFIWEKVCGPIIAFCRDPIPTSYRKREGFENIFDDKGQNSLKKNNTHSNKKGFSYLVKRFLHHLFKSGPRQTSRFISNYLKGR